MGICLDTIKLGKADLESDRKLPEFKARLDDDATDKDPLDNLKEIKPLPLIERSSHAQLSSN